MRDPDRVSQIVSTLEEVWTKYPDMRLTQLIVAAASQVQELNGPSPTFYIEDDSILLGLESLKKKNSSG